MTMLGFRWLQRIRLPLGFRSTISRGGVGYSWGIPGFRTGLSPSGRKWISFGFPTMGLSFFRYIGNQPPRRDSVFVDDDEFIEFPQENTGGQNTGNHINQTNEGIRTSKTTSERNIRKWKNVR